MTALAQLRYAIRILGNDRKAWNIAPQTAVDYSLVDPNSHLKHDNGNHLSATDPGEGIEVEVAGD